MPPTSQAIQEQLRRKREETIEHISDAFANDHVALEEFERRLALAHRAQDEGALAEVVQDLPARVSAPVAAASLPQSALPAVAMPPAVSTVLGSITRRGVWNVPAAMGARATLGSIVLDYRDAILVPGVNELHVKAFLGSIEIIVPPTLAVTVDGNAFLGSFDHVERAPVAPELNTPVLHVRGSALLGSVEVITRLPKGRNPKRFEP